MQRMFLGLGILFLLGGPFEIIAFFQIVPGFGADVRDQVPGPLWLKQIVSVMTPPMGAFMLLWRLRGISDLELSDDDLLLPISSPLGILRGRRRTIPLRDIEEVRITKGRRDELMEVDVRKADGGTRSRFFEMRWVADPEPFKKALRERARVVFEPRGKTPDSARIP